MSQLCPGVVLQKLDKLVEPLKLTCTTKANSVEKEYEKQDPAGRAEVFCHEGCCSTSLHLWCRQKPELANLFESFHKDSRDSLDNQMEEEMEYLCLKCCY